MNDKEALGLPPGSVRAIVFISFCVTVCIMVIWRIKQIPPDMWDILHLIVGFYFGSKTIRKEEKQ